MQNEFIKKHASILKTTWEWISIVGFIVAIIWSLLPIELTKIVLSFFGLSDESWTSSLKVFLLLNGIVGVYLRTIRVYFEEALQNVRRANRNDNIQSLLISYGIIKPSANEIPNDESACQVINNLLTLVAKYMHYYRVNIEATPYDGGVSTDYYIYTLAASHEEVDLNIMARYLTSVVNKIIKENKWLCKDSANNNVFHLPVLIALQNRNVILAEQVSNITGLPILTYQPARKVHDGKVCPEDRYNDGKDVYKFFYRVYLGCDKLKQKIVYTAESQSCESVYLHFILLDCNVTRGSSFVDVINDKEHGINYNDFVNMDKFVQKFCDGLGSIKVKFCGIHESATLFVAATDALLKDNSLQGKLRTVGLRLWYYFVLSEEIKAKLDQVKTNKPAMCYYSCNFGEVLNMRIEDDKLKKITGFSANGWFNAHAKTPEELIAFLPQS